MHNVLKFYSPTERALDSITNNKLWFSSSNELNDPFEHAVTYQWPNIFEKEKVYSQYMRAISREDYITAHGCELMIKNGDLVKNVEDLISIAIDNHKKDLEGIYTLSSSLNINGMDNSDNILMWSHYCDAFKGFCVEFFFDKLLNSFRDDGFLLYHKRIEYVTAPHQISVMECLSPSNEDYIKSVLKKYKAWEYEREYRFMSNNHGLLPFKSSSVKSFYIGYKMCNEYKNKLLNVIKHGYKSANIFEVSPSNKSYALNVKPLNI